MFLNLNYNMFFNTLPSESSKSSSESSKSSSESSKSSSESSAMENTGIQTEVEVTEKKIRSLMKYIKILFRFIIRLYRHCEFSYYSQYDLGEQKYLHKKTLKESLFSLLNLKGLDLKDVNSRVLNINENTSFSSMISILSLNKEKNDILEKFDNIFHVFYDYDCYNIDEYIDSIKHLYENETNWKNLLEKIENKNLKEGCQNLYDIIFAKNTSSTILLQSLVNYFDSNRFKDLNLKFCTNIINIQTTYNKNSFVLPKYESISLDGGEKFFKIIEKLNEKQDKPEELLEYFQDIGIFKNFKGFEKKKKR